jgi:hypothetical protein
MVLSERIWQVLTVLPRVIKPRESRKWISGRGDRRKTEVPFPAGAYLRVPEGVIGLWEKTGPGEGDDCATRGHARGVIDLDRISLDAKVKAV